MHARGMDYFTARLDVIAAGRMILQLGMREPSLSVGLAHIAHTSEAIVLDRAVGLAARERATLSEADNYGTRTCEHVHATNITGSIYDVVYGIGLSKLAHFDRIALEARRLLRPGGVLIIADGHRDAITGIVEAFGGGPRVRRFGWLRPSYVIEAVKGV